MGGFVAFTGIVAEVRERQQVNVDAVRNPSGPAAGDLPGGAEIGDVGDAQLHQRCPAAVIQAAQLAGPKQSARPQRARAVGDIAKVPRAGQFPDGGLTHVR